MVSIALLTRGSPNQLTGGHLYQRRLAERSASHAASIEFCSPGSPAHVLHPRDVIVVDSIVAWTAAVWAALHWPRRPLVALVHQPPGGVDQGRLRTEWQSRLDRLCYRRCALVVTPSRALAEELVTRHRLDANRIRVIEPGSDLPEPTDDLPDLRCGRRVALLCVANWSPNKGILELLEAVATLPGAAATLHLVGRTDLDAAYAGRVRARLQRADLAQRVVVHGAREPGELAQLYAAADVFVLASFAETYGIVYGEALRAGLPIVGWQAGNVRHLIDDGCEGRLAPVGAVAALGAALHELATDDAGRRRMAEAARARGRNLPTWDGAAEQFFAMLSRLAGTSG